MEWHHREQLRHEASRLRKPVETKSWSKVRFFENALWLQLLVLARPLPALMVPPNRKVTRVELLKAEKDVKFEVAGSAVTFTIPSVLDYEVAAIYSA